MTIAIVTYLIQVPKVCDMSTYCKDRFEATIRDILTTINPP